MFVVAVVEELMAEVVLELVVVDNDEHFPL
jgi:hypothetical protein